MYDPSKSTVIVIHSKVIIIDFKATCLLLLIVSVVNQFCLQVCVLFVGKSLSASSLLQCQQLKIMGVAVQTKNPNPRPKVFIRYFVEPKILS